MCIPQNVPFVPLSPKTQTSSPHTNTLGSFFRKQALSTCGALTSAGSSGFPPSVMGSRESPRLISPPCSGKQLWDSEDQEGLHASVLTGVECVRACERRMDALFCFRELLGKRPALVEFGGRPAGRFLPPKSGDGVARAGPSEFRALGPS